MKISSESTVQEIFDQFNVKFPYLRLEFYKSAHDVNAGSPEHDQVSHQTTIGQLNPEIESTEVILDENMTVTAFENWMKERIGLHVQVFRKSAGIWLQTTATDHWTLEKQNGKGQRSVEDHHIEPIDIRDFDVE